MWISSRGYIHLLVQREHEGFIIPNGSVEPGLHSVMLHGDLDGGGVKAWFMCEGRREYVGPEGGEVA